METKELISNAAPKPFVFTLMPFHSDFWWYI